MTSSLNYQAYGGNYDRDAEHLKILAICWYVLAGLSLFFGLFPLIYVGLGAMVLANPKAFAPPPAIAIPVPATSTAPATGAGAASEPAVEAPGAATAPVFVHVVAPAGPGPSLEPMAWFFIIFGSVGTLFFWLTTVLGIAAGICLPRRRRLWLCYTAAGLACLQIPIGTTLGVFTFVVLSRSSVRSSFL